MTSDDFVVGGEWEDHQAFLEQDDATVYFYLCDLERVLYDLHIGNRRAGLSIQRKDVQVVRTKDRFGVFIQGKLRGVIATNGDRHRPANALVGEGVIKVEWQEGFDSARPALKPVVLDKVLKFREEYWKSVATPQR
jgi:hypothetical protein